MGDRHFGLIGVGVMGQNLALNIERNGFPMAVFDRSVEKVRVFVAGKAAGCDIVGAATVEEFVGLLARPRRVVLLVNAGKPVDDVLAALVPLLAAGDVVVDGGNSYFEDTERRAAALAETGIGFVGSGVSGGEEGALHGPSLMPGGDPAAYALIEPMLTRIAARVEGEPCCTYIGPRGAGHYVKMVHNGIEYAIMQVIGEAYDVLRSVVGLTAGEIGELFAAWNAIPELNSYLFEITAKVLARVDEETGRPLVDLILDTAEQKGTGKWTSQNAFDLGVAIPTINAAVEARMLSGLKEQRVKAAALPAGRSPTRVAADVQVDDVRDALHASIIVSYAQGMALLQAASRAYGYGLKLDRIAAIWRGGCIIRARMLEPIRRAFERDPELSNLMVDETFAGTLATVEGAWRRVVGAAIAYPVPVLATGASLAYHDAYRRERLPANLLQAQRDFFGAHTYRRIDREGVFHTEWEK